MRSTKRGVASASIRFAASMLKSRNRIAHPTAKRTDMRETAARFNFPSQRQTWVESSDGRLVNSAEGIKRAIPAYMLCLDLVFAASFNLISDMLVPGLDHFHYFYALFIPIWGLWQHLIYLFNRFDPEDVTSEIFVIIFSSGLLAAAQAASTCSWANGDTLYAQHSNGDAGCRYFVFCFFGLRLTLTAYTLYICWHVRKARRLMARELFYVIVLTPLICYIAIRKITAYDPWFWSMWLIVSLIDDMLFILMPVALAWLKERDICVGIVLKAEINVPPNVVYQEARYERMVTIAIGTVRTGLKPSPPRRLWRGPKPEPPPW